MKFSIKIKDGLQKKAAMKIVNTKGFSLIEALIAIAIISIALIGLAGMQGLFATQTVDRTVQNSLVDAASSALTHCQNVNTSPPASYTYENGLVVNIALIGSCSVALNTCNSVTATATARDKSFAMTTQICNFK